MGLFDSYFDPQTYSGNGGGGLIDRLLSQLQTQGQYQPAAGFPAAENNQPSPQMAAPIAVGDNYQMPRIGSPQQFMPDPAAIPQNAMPAQGQMPQGSPMQAPMQAPQPQPLPSFMGGAGTPQNPGLGDRLSAGLNSFAGNTHNGLIGAVLGGINGLATGQRNDPRGEQQQLMQAQYRALIPILGEANARLAVINPEAGKLLMTQALGPKAVQSLGEGYIADSQGNVRRAYEPGDKNKIVKTGQDGLGREEYQVFNPADGSLRPVKPQNADAGGGIGNMDLTGKDFLASMPREQANTVQLMVEGKIAPPSSFALAKPYWANLIAAAKNYDPTFDATAWSGRVAGVKDFSAGKSSEMVRSANQTLHHVGSLLDSMDALKNGDYPLWNKVGNATAEATGSGAQGSFRTNAHAVAEELSKVFKGSNLSDAEIHAWEQNLHENMSPEQQRTQVAKLKELLQGSLHALEEKRLAAIGPMAAEKAGPIIKEDAQRVMDRIDQWVKGDKAAPAATVAPLAVGESATIGKVTIKKVSH